MGVPSMRVTSIKDVIAVTNELPEAQRQRIQAAIPEGLQERVAAEFGTGWIALRDYVQFLRPVHEVLSPDEKSKFFQDVSLRSMAHPLLRPVLEFAIKLSGASPRTLIKATVSGWGSIVRDCGELRFVESKEKNTAALELRLTPELRTAEYVPTWLESTRLTMYSFYVLTHSTGSVTLEVPPSREVVRFVFRWS